MSEDGVVSINNEPVGYWTMENDGAVFYVYDEDFELTPVQFHQNVRLGEKFQNSRVTPDNQKLH